MLCALSLVTAQMAVLAATSSEAQGAGAGLALLREAVRITRAEKLDGLLLEVRPSNHRAIRLYERFGFASIGRRKNYYPARHRSREDAIVNRYWKNLGLRRCGCVAVWRRSRPSMRRIVAR